MLRAYQVRRNVGAMGGPAALVARRLAGAAGKGIGKLLRRAPAARAAATRVASRVRSIPGIGAVAGTAGGVVAYEGASRAVRGLSRGGAPKKRRTRNPANVKALRRAISRIDAAEKLFRKVLAVRKQGSAKITPKKGRR